jgi:3-deoxy-D-manno-octulosonate 8-phosphate phosphatase (KDO 8-P phosphatase)
MCYVGDDLVDLPALARVGFPVAPADAVAEVRSAAAWVTRAPGGRGAVRELVEMILKAQGSWADLVRRHERELF